MNQFIHVCVETRNSSVRIAVSCDVRALCDVDLLLLQPTWEMLSTLANCAKSPAHKVSTRRWNRCHTHMNTISGLTFIPRRITLKCLATNLSRSHNFPVFLKRVTDISNYVRRILHCLNWQHRVCSLTLMSSNAPQITNTAFNIVRCQLCYCSLLCFSR